MKTLLFILKIIAVVILGINGFSALYGGYQMMIVPTGETMNLQLSYLAKSPFNNYFIPGLILFFVNGVFSVITLISILIKHKNYPFMLVLQGVLLVGWIVIQIILIQIFYPIMHLSFIAMGLYLIVSGFFIMRFSE